jgi:hypothetical protein
MTNNINAAQAIAKAVMYYDREISQEIIHAVEYYKCCQSQHSQERLTNAVNAAVTYARQTYGFKNREVVDYFHIRFNEAAA